MMKQIIYSACMVLLLNGLCILRVEAQTKFELPNRSPDYGSYLYLDDCVAAAIRVDRLPKVQYAVVDTFRSERKAKYSAISGIAKDTGQMCAGKWSAESFTNEDFLKHWAKAFMILGRSSEVREIYTRHIDSIPTSEKLDAKRALMALFAQYKEKETVDEWLKISADYFNDIPQDSFVLVANALASQVVNWVALWMPEQADTALNKYLAFVDSLPLDRRKSPIITTLIAPRFFETAVVVKEAEVLARLSKSTTEYSEYLKELWTNVGNDRPRILPIDSIAPDIKGKWWYIPQGTRMNDLVAAKMPIDSTVRPVKGKINAIAFIEPGCHTSSPKARSNPFVRQNAEGTNCPRSLTALNRLKEAYPDLQITIASRTFGSFGSTLSASPEAEAETIAKYIIEHYKVNAYVAIEEGEYFTLPGLDKRRVDLPSENDANYLMANTKLSRHGNVVLVDPDGRIFFNGAIDGDDEVAVHNMIGAVMKRNQTQTAQRQ